MYPIFDGHNDFLTDLSNASEPRGLWPGGRPSGHLDLPRMRSGGFVGGFFAIWIPSRDTGLENVSRNSGAPYCAPLPPEVSFHEAQRHAMSQAAAMLWMERVAPDDFAICRSGQDLRAALDRKAIAAIMHMEGAEAIDPDMQQLYFWHEVGLRSLGPVWSRPNTFGYGVPFAYPSGPDTGAGLTENGKKLIRTCDDLGILVDLSHLNEKGFDDVACISSRPLIATHSNAHALTPVARNLTDRQLRIIAESGGIVGLNFSVAMLNPTGSADPNTGVDDMLRHLDYLLDLLGENSVALGSDYDGAQIPAVIGDVGGAQVLCQAMLNHGYGENLVRKIASENWLVKLEEWLG